MTERSIVVAVLMAEGAGVLLSVLVFYAHGIRSRLQRAGTWIRGRGRRELVSAAAMLERMAVGEVVSSSNLEPLRALRPRQQLRLLVDVLWGLSGVSTDVLAPVARELGLVHAAEVGCRSRWWWRRLHAARFLALLGVESPSMLPLLNDRHPVVRLQAVEWAGQHPGPTVIGRLLELLAQESGASSFAIQDSLLRMGASITGPLIDYLQAHHGPEIESALRVAAGIGDPRFLGPALHHVSSSSPSVRAQVAAVVGSIGGSQAGEALAALLHDPEPPVRAAAARALGALGHWPAAPTIAQLLRDPAWDVRLEAGRALAALGAPGLLFLRRYRDDDDRFAADMAHQVLDLLELQRIEAQRSAADARYDHVS